MRADRKGVSIIVEERRFSAAFTGEKRSGASAPEGLGR